MTETPVEVNEDGKLVRAETEEPDFDENLTFEGEDG
jgi:hypothetical protein